ncbi:MAG TPA: ATP-dependent DNA helicase [Patescibacteria group bacterium]|jgi:DNA helicase-2/ATP-dependent DNA helicase PcrA|nr:ATP-dependent DNA helicase [Patescibacteria group bacterium]
MQFSDRYRNLNERQRLAVDTLDGPLLVLAGPGTGKTELLSMRAANILQKTDTPPSSILCLTFTDSGAVAMRERLAQIIGPEAYKVAIHTFHSFGTEIINQHAEYFFRGAQYEPADSLAQYEIMRGIFDELDYTNPLASMNGDEYIYLRDATTVISELKRSGLTSDELRQVLDENDAVIDFVERDLSEIFSNRISKTAVHLLAPVAEKVAALDQPTLPPAVTPYANTLALSLAHAIDQAIEADSTKPITAWKNAWTEKNAKGQVVLKDRARQEKLRALAHVYYEYITRMQTANLFDYDDMILEVIHTMEMRPELQANLQEKYLYIMVDEFQDTNLAQLRLLFDLTNGIEQPNVMAVGDDDQAIYSFQGADIGNIQRFRTEYDDPVRIVLTDNYRSAPVILESSRAVITLGSDRLENTIDDLVKELTPHVDSEQASVELHSFSSSDEERLGVAEAIKATIDNGAKANSIAVIARRHHELVALLPYLSHVGVQVNYERRENVLEDETIRLLEHIFMIIDALHRDAHDEADALLPEILAHPAWGYEPHDIYKLSLAAYRNHQLWLEVMQTQPIFKPFADWLIVRSAAIHVEPLEVQIDTVLGIDSDNDDTDGFTSPLYAYFFSREKLTTAPDAYLATLEALRTIRDQLREHYGHEVPSVQTLLEFFSMHRELGSSITAIRRRGDGADDRIQLMTAHKSKGLEFEHVFVLGAVDNMWGERVRSRSRLINYPANLPLAPSGDSFDERLRLFFVAMTRAKRTLSISFSAQDNADKPTLVASFLSDTEIPTMNHEPTSDIVTLTARAELDWRGHLARSVDTELRDLLMPTLESYKLSATHVGNFLDVSKGGPDHFLLNNLLRFPQAKSAHASYGTAIHATLQRAHDFYHAMGEKRPIEDVLGDYERILRDQHLSEPDFETFYARGIDSLGAYFAQKYDSFTPTQRTEIGFGMQGVVVEDALLTGALDLVDLDAKEKTIRVTDYKTGKPSRDWKGKSEYEKIKLHKYRQQLMFYQLLIENSRDYHTYRFTGGTLQFVEPLPSGEIVELEEQFSQDDIDRFRLLIKAIWQRIMNLDLPDTSEYSPTLKGIQEFESWLIDNLE